MDIQTIKGILSVIAAILTHIVYILFLTSYVCATHRIVARKHVHVGKH